MQGGVTQIQTIAPGQSRVVLTAGLPSVIPKNGYLYIYVSNESPQDVFFDNVTVQHHRGPLLQESHTYPFGLEMAAISEQSAGKLENKLRYNKGSELQHEEFSDGSGLDTYTTLFRMVDPQIGRWWQIDPKCEASINPDAAEVGELIPEGLESMTPYGSMDDNPVLYNDPKGDCPNCVTAVVGAGIGALFGGFVEAGTQLWQHGKITSWRAIGGAAVQGGFTGLVAGFTGGASLAAAGLSKGAALLVTAAASGSANALGGAVKNRIEGKSITVASVSTDFSIGFLAGGLGAYLGDKAGLFLSKWSKIGSTGKVGENILKGLGGESQVYFETPVAGGGRYVDQLVDDIAHESKVGYTSLTESIKRQIAKDVELIKAGEIKGAVWHFFKSPVTKLGGATQPLLDELKKNGISFFIH